MFKKISLIISILPLLCACNSDWVTKDWNISPINSSPKFLKDPNGQDVAQCDGSSIPLRNGGPERFWEENNLPKGTINFVCKNGKAYLPGQVPKD